MSGKLWQVAAWRRGRVNIEHMYHTIELNGVPGRTESHKVSWGVVEITEEEPVYPNSQINDRRQTTDRANIIYHELHPPPMPQGPGSKHSRCSWKQQRQQCRQGAAASRSNSLRLPRRWQHALLRRSILHGCAYRIVGISVGDTTREEDG